jgi:hypothetical protein
MGAKKSRKPRKNNRPPSVGEQQPQADSMAQAMVGPYLRHGVVNRELAEKMAGTLPGAPTFHDFALRIGESVERNRKAGTGFASELLTAQAISLDALFTEFARRAASAIDEYPHAAEAYARLALKAQSNCRATLDTLVKLHQPREQTVRHVHVNEGAQAVIADQFHHHGGQENEQSNKQPHATGTCQARQGTPLPSPDPLGDPVSISSHSRAAALSYARGKRKRRT